MAQLLARRAAKAAATKRTEKEEIIGFKIRVARRLRLKARLRFNFQRLFPHEGRIFEASVFKLDVAGFSRDDRASCVLTFDC